MNNATLRVRLPLFVFLSYAAVAACVLLSSCAFGDNADVVPTVAADDEVMYVVGRYNIHACMWIMDGALMKRIMLPELSGTSESWAMSVIVKGKDIVISGVCMSGTYYNVLWVNGALVRLTATSSPYDMYTSGVVRRDGKLYATVTHGGATGMAGVWVNGTVMNLPLPPTATESKALCIAVDDNHVIVGGAANVIDTNFHACVWVDGACTVLETTSFTPTEIYSVGWHDGHWYAAGNSTASTLATLWIDGAYVRVNPVSTSNLVGMHVHDGVPYTCGHQNNIACMWAGTQKLTLTSASPSEAYGILVYDSTRYGRNIIVAGRADDAGTMAAMLWINGTGLQLDKAGAVYVTDARAVAFGPRNW